MHERIPIVVAYADRGGQPRLGGRQIIGVKRDVAHEVGEVPFLLRGHRRITIKRPPCGGDLRSSFGRVTAAGRDTPQRVRETKLPQAARMRRGRGLLDAQLVAQAVPALRGVEVAGLEAHRAASFAISPCW
jgi:hypothetical protein